MQRNLEWSYPRLIEDDRAHLGKKIRAEFEYRDRGYIDETHSGDERFEIFKGLPFVVTDTSPPPQLKSLSMNNISFANKIWTLDLTFDKPVTALGAGQSLNTSDYSIGWHGLSIDDRYAYADRTTTSVKTTADTKTIQITYTSTIDWNPDDYYTSYSFLYKFNDDDPSKALSNSNVYMKSFSVETGDESERQYVTYTDKNLNRYVMGNVFDDVINGSWGDDVFWGNKPSAPALGEFETDKDTFTWKSGDAGKGSVDTIKDFQIWTTTFTTELGYTWTSHSGDRLDITGLLQGYSDGNTLTNWIKTVDTGRTVNGVANSSVMTIDVDGAGSGTVTQVIQFEGFNILSGYAQATLELKLQAMLASGAIL